MEEKGKKQDEAGTSEDIPNLIDAKDKDQHGSAGQTGTTTSAGQSSTTTPPAPATEPENIPDLSTDDDKP